MSTKHFTSGGSTVAHAGPPNPNAHVHVSGAVHVPCAPLQATGSVNPKQIGTVHDGGAGKVGVHPGIQTHVSGAVHVP